MLPEIALVKVDDRISDSEAACLQSLSDSVAAVETAQHPDRRHGGDLRPGEHGAGVPADRPAQRRRAGRSPSTCATNRAGSRASSAPITPSTRGPATSVAAIRDLTGGNGADVVFECAGGSPKQGLAGTQTLLQAIDAVRSGGKIIGVSWFGGPLELDVDLLRERSLRYLFPDISTQAHLEHTVRLVASGRVR